MRGDARNVNDAAAATRYHGWTEFLARRENSANEVEIETCLPICELKGFKWPFGSHGNFRIVAARCIYQHGCRT
jgi:hypothetical protein